MPDDKLTLVETCALLTLLKEGQEIANADLKNERGFELKSPHRNRLEKLGLIDVRKEKNRIFLGVSEKGWAGALEAIGSVPPARSGYAGATIYAQVAAIRQFLETSGLALSEFYAPAPRRPAAEPGEVVALVRKAYDELAQAPGDAVRLARIRAALPEIGRDDLDAALIALHREDGVRVFAEANQKTLTDADRSAAVSIGNQDKHLLQIR
ncbi:hypothetical protein [Couchioplanes caeruleus]|uniref:Uncharacterized protein n=2 Tax=Couchioplanes caeruleus TaxID=56438 RepID=A0A1K0FR75_9ACTN|nr:hypothetical protein [Couchioplanes caeruleus]OJF15333.1 hypothetical protein BG844_05160 [Couchioplanes caeruleus subsp. caeruleus]ROP29472.1 hypothetical protein EDD30_2267 [Couchioplanes caeruleus]